MKKKIIPKHVASWLLVINKNTRTKDYYIDLPNSIINDFKWTDEDSLIWTPQEDGSFKVSKVEKKS